MSSELPEISLKEILMVPDGPPESVWRTALDAALADTGGSEGDLSAPGDVDETTSVADENAEADDQYDDVADHPEAEGTLTAPWEDSNRTEPSGGTEPEDAGSHDY